MFSNLICRSLLSRLVNVFLKTDIWKLWLIMVVGALILTELIACGMETLLIGYITSDYLITGVVASIIVASTGGGIILYFAAELKRMNEALRESETLLQQSQMVASVGHYVYDLTTGYWSSSEVLDGIFGIDSSFVRDVAGWLSLVHPEERKEMSVYLRDYVIGESHSFDQEYRIMHPSDGSVRWIHGLGRLVVDAQNRPIRMFGTIQDITQRKDYETRLERIAHYDALTGIPNRVLLGDRMALAIAHTRRTEKLMAICYLDLDGFKPINDRYGHEIGDSFLKEMAGRLLDCLRGGDTVARLGGDEFILLLLDFNNVKECEVALRRILDVIARPVAAGGKEETITASVGVSLYSGEEVDPDTLLRQADQAMYGAKQAGRNRYQMFR
jgi:diguanylate cyclase (GGDEF)-like protein/PAS domain S-box-containing protein